jgi:hypothetical protein
LRTTLIDGVPLSLTSLRSRKSHSLNHKHLDKPDLTILPSCATPHRIRAPLHRPPLPSATSSLRIQPRRAAPGFIWVSIRRLPPTTPSAARLLHPGRHDLGASAGLPCPAPHQIRRLPRRLHLGINPPPPPPATPSAARLCNPAAMIWARPRSPALSGTPSDQSACDGFIWVSIRRRLLPPRLPPPASCTRPPCLGASAVPCLVWPRSVSEPLRATSLHGFGSEPSSFRARPLPSGVLLQASVHAPLRSSLHWFGAALSSLASPRLVRRSASGFSLGRVFVSSWFGFVVPLIACAPDSYLVMHPYAGL